MTSEVLQLRPTVIDVDLDAVAANFHAIREAVAPADVMPILKADAYGHGLVPAAERLEREGARSFGVAFLEEALRLREAGVGVPILALGGISGRQIERFIEHDIDITASSVMKLELIDAQAVQLRRRARVHLKIDTGIGRIGTSYRTAATLFEAALKCRHSDIVGVFSHLAKGEDEDTSFTRLQLERFDEAFSFFEKHSLPKPIRHIANSGGILQDRSTHLDLVRPGLLLYGVLPAAHFKTTMPLRRTLTLRSEVVFFKVVPQGTGISYDHTWHAPTATRIATVPVGYGDGYARRLGNRAHVLIRGRRYPIVGKVCMDQFMVDLGPDGTAYNGDEVMLIGSQGEEEVTIEELARLIDEDARDLLLRLSLRIPRRYHGA